MTIEELRNDFNEKQKAQNKIDAAYYTRRSELEADARRAISVKLTEEFGTRVQDAKRLVDQAQAAVKAEQDRLALLDVETPFPVGTVMVEWVYPKYSYGKNESLRPTTTRGVIEIIQPDSVHPANSRWPTASVGSVVIRMLRSNGKPGKEYTRVIQHYQTRKWTMNNWYPEGVNPNGEALAEAALKAIEEEAGDCRL